jgi:hypothetical protein
LKAANFHGESQEMLASFFWLRLFNGISGHLANKNGKYAYIYEKKCVPLQHRSGECTWIYDVTA